MEFFRQSKGFIFDPPEMPEVETVET